VREWKKESARESENPTPASTSKQAKEKAAPRRQTPPQILKRKWTKAGRKKRKGNDEKKETIKT
jgi:hypothetical protein